MKRLGSLLLLGVIGCVLLNGCKGCQKGLTTGTSAGSSKVLATVNGEKIALADLVFAKMKYGERGKIG